jgi:hypothetical protein
MDAQTRAYFKKGLDEAKELWVDAVIEGADSDLLVPLFTELLACGSGLRESLIAAADEREADTKGTNPVDIHPLDIAYSLRIAAIYREMAQRLDEVSREDEAANNALETPVIPTKKE